MSLERFFVFLYPEDQRLRELLDLAVYILNPDEKWPAHITLAGPYDRKSITPRKRVLTSKISALGAGEFRSANQNTIFLKVGGGGIGDFWHKPNYANSRITPHLTLYDGQSASFADALVTVLHEIRVFFFFYVSGVDIVSSVKGQSSRVLETVVNFNALAQASGLTPRATRALRDEERIFLAGEALRKAKYYMTL